MENYEIKHEDKMMAHSDRVWCVRWHPNGRWFASCGSDRTIKIWAKEGEKWKCLSQLDGSHERTIRYISWSHNGRFLASASFDGTACIWHQKSDKKYEWTVLVILEGHENEVKSVAWSPEDRFLATCSRDKSVWIWEKIELGQDVANSSGDLENLNPQDAIFECASVQTEHSQDVKCVIWHPKLNILVSSSFDNSINLYCQDVDDWCCYSQLIQHESTVWAVTFNPNGTRMVSVSADETIKIWQPKDYHVLIDEIDTITSKRYSELTKKWFVVASLSGYHQWPIYDVSWSARFNFILTTGADNSLHVFKEFLNDQNDLSSVRYRQICQKTDAHEQDINSIHWNSCEKDNDENESIIQFATGSDDGFVQVWSFKYSTK